MKSVHAKFKITGSDSNYKEIDKYCTYKVKPLYKPKWPMGPALNFGFL